MVASLGMIVLCTSAAAPNASFDNCTLTLQRQLSSTRCLADGSGIGHSGCWNSNKSMWVEDGCRGYFVCDGQPNVYCGAGIGKRATCPCISGPPLPPTPPPPPLWPECGTTGIDPKTGACYATCLTIPNRTACGASPYKCVWQGSKCTDPLQCVEVANQAACAASPFECAWTNGRCNTTLCNFNGQCCLKSGNPSPAHL